MTAKRRALFLILPVCLKAATYFVSPTGLDSSIGTMKQPFRTIQHAASRLQAGDSCIIRAGTFRETIRPANSGTASAPIVFSSFPFETAVVTGCDTVDQWTPHDGAIYKAPVDWAVKDVFVSGDYMLWARHPNMPWSADSGFNFMDQPVGTDNQPDSINWNGVTRWEWRRADKWVRKSVHANSWDYFDGAFYGIRGLLDTAREWCRQNDTLYLQPPPGVDPNNALVEAKRRRFAFDLRDRSHIIVHGITIKAASLTLDGASSCLIDKCHITYVKSFFHVTDGFCRDRGNSATVCGGGILIGGSDNIIRNSYVAHSWGDGVTVYGSGNTVYNCVIHDVDWLGIDCAPVALSGRRQTVRRNTLFYSGRANVLFRKTYKSIIDSNHMHSSGYLTSDMGAMYTCCTRLDSTIIACNWIHSSKGYGIYFDNSSLNAEIHHNVFWQCGRPVHLNCGSYNGFVNMYHNTAWDNGRGFRVYGGAPNAEIHSYNNLTQYRAEGTGYTNIPFKYFIRSPEIDTFLVNAAGFDFRPKAGTIVIDSGKYIDGFEHAYTGNRPDIGAYELGGEYWIPGHNWDNGEGPVIFPRQTTAREEWQTADRSAGQFKGISYSIYHGGIITGASQLPTIRCTLRNALGQTILTASLSEQNPVIPTGNLGNGLYFLELSGLPSSPVTAAILIK
ncbi:MAG: hypothetical protein GF398_20325 [Chitinivibrionales bacterium]|nr:hypothetical protein [Chitinivibrionales bacterium]